MTEAQFNSILITNSPDLQIITQKSLFYILYTFACAQWVYSWLRYVVRKLSPQFQNPASKKKSQDKTDINM